MAVFHDLLLLKGMKQRVLIAASLMHDPKLLIFDEPLSGLDVVSSRLFKDLLEEAFRAGQSHPLYFACPGSRRADLQSGDRDREGQYCGGRAPSELTKMMQLASLESVFA